MKIRYVVEVELDDKVVIEKFEEHLLDFGKPFFKNIKIVRKSKENRK